ncbi:MAG: hypothetical protein KA210_11730 [Bacteroidia bacterium]|nr:hypothetical protein [Bacteroidia bacterium]
MKASPVNAFCQYKDQPDATLKFISNIQKYRIENKIDDVYNDKLNFVNLDSNYTFILSDSVETSSGIELPVLIDTKPEDMIKVVDYTYADIMFDSLIKTNSKFKQICSDLDIDNYIIGCTSIYRENNHGEIIGYYVFDIFSKY